MDVNKVKKFLGLGCDFCGGSGHEKVEGESIPTYSGDETTWYYFHESCLTKVLKNPENYDNRSIDYALECLNWREYRITEEKKRSVMKKTRREVYIEKAKKKYTDISNKSIQVS